MKVVVQEKVNKIITPEQKIFNVVVDLLNSRNTIPEDIGLMKGDIIVYRGAGDPVRFSAGNAAGKTLLTDPTSETGWVLGNASEGTGATVTLRNVSGEMISAGTIVKITTGTNFVKAEKGDTVSLFIVSENCEDDTEVSCYAVSNTVCFIRCTSGAVNVGARLTISATDGLCESTADVSDRLVGIALTAKDNTSIGVVKALLLEIGRMEHVRKTGDTMTGNLVLNNGAKAICNTDIDVDVSPLKSLSYTPVVWYDKYGNEIAHVELQQGSDNQMVIKFGIRRLIGNTWTWNLIRYHVTPDGDTFLNNDGLNVYQDYILSDVSLKNNIETDVGTITLKRGAYIVTITGAFVTNSSGYRRISLEGYGAGYLTMVNERACADVRTVIGKSFPINVYNDTVFTLRAQQNSGGALSVSPRIRVMKIA